MSKTKVGNVRLDGRTLTHGRTSYDVAGATATVETDGEVVARFTATRILFLGIFALAFKKKKDKRGLYLMVDGPDYAFVDELDPKKDATKAREVAQAINQAGKQFAQVQVAAVAIAPPTVTLQVPAAQPLAIDAPISPAAWHPDPHGIARLRYWDGTTWTEHTAE